MKSGFGSMVCVKRTRKLLTDKDIQNARADILEISQNTLSEYLSKKLPSEPKANIIFKVAEHFCVSIDYLMGRSRYQNKVFSMKLSEFASKYGLSSHSLNTVEEIVKTHSETSLGEFPVSLIFEMLFQSESFQECINRLAITVEIKSHVDKHNHPDYTPLSIFGEGKYTKPQMNLGQHIIEYNLSHSFKAFMEIYGNY